MNVTAYVDAYLTGLESRVKPRPFSPLTISAYRSDLRRFAQWLGDRRVSDTALNAYREHLQRDRRPRTIRRAFTAIAQFLAWAREQGESVPNGRGVWLPPLDEPLRDVPSDDDVSALFRAAAGMEGYSRQQRFERARALAVLSLAADCGLRRGEILALDRADVELAATPARLQVRAGKGGRARWVPLNTRAREHLAHYLSVWREWAEWVPARQANPALFALRVGGRMDDRHVDQLRHRLLHAAGLEMRRLHLHSLRHWFISRALAVSGVNLKDVMEIVGHSNAETTLRYTHARLQSMILAVEGVCPLPVPAPEPSREKRAIQRRESVRDARRLVRRGGRR